MSRRRRHGRGPPFFEIHGHLYLNQAFDLDPMADDIRELVGADYFAELPARNLIVARRLTHQEECLVRQIRRDADTEAWAKLTAP